MIKFNLLRLFLSVRFYHSHSRYDILQITVDIIAFFPLQMKPTVNIFSEKIGDHYRKRDKNKTKQRQLYTQRQHKDNITGKDKTHRKHVAKGPLHKITNLPCIKYDAVHQLSRPSVIDKTQGEDLDLGEKFFPQILGDLRPQNRTIITFQYIYHHDPHTQEKHNTQTGKCHSHASTAICKHIIHQVFLYLRIKECHHCCQDHQNDDTHKIFLVRS